jgi:hypothetical protein
MQGGCLIIGDSHFHFTSNSAILFYLALSEQYNEQPL